jgi:hypothetical protein
MKTTFQVILLSGIMICSLIFPAGASTGKGSSSSQQVKLTVTTVRVTEIKATQAKCTFSVQGSPISEKGVCYSDGPSPTISNKKSMAPGNPTNTGISIMGGLKPATTYYVRAYAKCGSEVFYGNDLSFTTTATDQSKSTNQNTGQKVESKPTNSK